MDERKMFRWIGGWMIYIQIVMWMDGWMMTCSDRWIDGKDIVDMLYMDRYSARWMNGWIDIQLDGWMIDVQMDGYSARWMDDRCSDG